MIDYEIAGGWSTYVFSFVSQIDILIGLELSDSANDDRLKDMAVLFLIQGLVTCKA